MSGFVQPEFFSTERTHMVAHQLRARGIVDERVLAAMARVPRHEFVPAEFRLRAYGDHPIPIGQGQTISQPFIVALMLEALDLAPGQVVLEVGTGSGYQAALLADLGARVYSVERHPALAQSAKQVLVRLGYGNVTVLVGDGSLGVPEHAPYNVIVVSAATPEIPPALFEQLTEGGRLLVPVGPPEAQYLQLVRKQEGKPVTTELEGCRFVPLISGVGSET
jgi:protein-L-isoaspartate(D-aspartate) O-methyltransferase